MGMFDGIRRWRARRAENRFERNYYRRERAMEGGTPELMELRRQMVADLELPEGALRDTARDPSLNPAEREKQIARLQVEIQRKREYWEGRIERASR